MTFDDGAGGGLLLRETRSVVQRVRLIWAVLMMICAAGAPALAAPRGAPATPAFEEPHGADLNQGKPPAEIFKSDCSVCHKSPQGLAKGGGANLQTYLRQHYTTGTTQAAALAGYLASLGRGGAAEKPTSPERAGPNTPAATAPATARRTPPAASEPAANDGLTTPAPERPRRPIERAARQPEPSKPLEPAPPEAEPSPPVDAPVPAPVEAAPPPAEAPAAAVPEVPPAPAPSHRGRGQKPQEAAKPEAKPAPSRRNARVQEQAKPAEAEKPAAAAAAPEPAPAAATPPPEPKPAAPQIPL